MRKILGLVFFLISALPAFAQGGFTTVTGTITGPDSVVWACGTISAQLITAGGPGATLNGGGFTSQTSPVGLGCPTSPGTGANGSFSMRLADSGVINPSNTTWKFTVNMAPGIAPPAGTGPQSFTVTTAINCGTNTPATCTSNTINISALLSAAAPTLSNGAAGAAFPVTTPVTVNSGGSISATGTGIIVSTATSSPKGLTDAGSSTVYLTDPKYNFPGTTQWSCQAVISNGSNIVTTQASDRPFTGNPVRNAVIGDVIYAANAQCGGEDAIQVPITLIARGTITSVDSAHQVHVSNNASANCVIANQDNCVFYWGPDAFASVQAAWVDTGNACGILVLPAGGIMLSAEPNNTTALCPGPSSGNDVGSSLRVTGQGGYVTMLIMWPDAPFTHTMFQDPLGGQRRECTIGTVASQVAYVQGDILAVAATAGVADTLANVKGTIVAQ